MSTPIVVLGSGRGSNFEAILEAVRSGRLAADIRAVISDRQDALILEKARAAGIPAIHVPCPSASECPDVSERRRRHDGGLLEAIAEHRPRYLVMAGYLRVVSPVLIDAFRDERGFSRITNIHPSLLPSFPGLNSYDQAFRHGAKVTGVTVHLVDHGVDEGPICAQEAFAISDCPTEQEVAARGLAIEHRLYPATLSWILGDRFRTEPAGEKGRIRVRPT